MRLTLTIDTDNAAFSDGYLGIELDRILRVLGEKLVRDAGASVMRDGMSYQLMDSNGNTVGKAELS